MYKFQVLYNNELFSTKVIYRDEEYSFAAEPVLESDITLLVNSYIQVGFSSWDKFARKVYGLSPYTGWHIKQLDPPRFQKGRLVLINKLKPGGPAYQVEGTENWQSKFDYSKGWFCVGNNQTSDQDSAVEFALDTIAVVDRDANLKSLWWKPEFRHGFNLEGNLGIKNMS